MSTNSDIVISSFEVTGNQRTNLALFENEFAKSCKSKSFRDLENSLDHSISRMKAMDIFKSMDVQVKILSKEKGQSANIAVVVAVKEKSMPSLKVMLVLSIQSPT